MGATLGFSLVLHGSEGVNWAVMGKISKLWLIKYTDTFLNGRNFIVIFHFIKLLKSHRSVTECLVEIFIWKVDMCPIPA